jgi:hypothetical protein
MALNAYSVCPLGSGKKVKFCCPREHLADYLKVFELMEVEQFAAAESLTDRLVGKAPDEVCFLGLKATFMDPADEAPFREITERLVQVAPDHPITFAAQVNVALLDDDLPRAISRAQDSIERLENAVPQMLLNAMEGIAECAYYHSSIQAAMGWTLYALMLTKFRFSAAFDFLLNLQRDPMTPPSLKELMHHRLQEVFPSLSDPRLIQMVDVGRWRVAVAELTRLVEQQPENPWAVGMLAATHGLLAEEEASYRYWRRLAEMPDVPLYLAADATLIAEHQLDRVLAPGERDIPRMILTYTIPDMDRAMELFLSDRRFEVAPPPPDHPVGPDEPIPKAYVTFLSHEPPRVGEGEECPPLEQFPLLLAGSILHGRQTDQEARIEVIGAVFPGLALREIIDERLGDVVARPPEEHPETAGLSRHEINAKYMRHGFHVLPPEQRYKLFREAQREVISDRWFREPHVYLDEKRPEEVVGDPAYLVRLVAGRVMFEITPFAAEWDESFAPCWERLGLPGELRPTSMDEVLFNGRSALLHTDPEGLSDEDLMTVYNMCAEIQLTHAARRFAEVVIRRPGLRSSADLHKIFIDRWRAAQQPEIQLKRCEDAEQWGREVGVPIVGVWKLYKAISKVNMGDLEGAMVDIESTMKNHIDEPGAREVLHQVLTVLGFLDRHGKPSQEMARVAGGGQTSQGGPDTGTGIWTPDQATGDAPAPSKLWLPGMD